MAEGGEAVVDEAGRKSRGQQALGGGVSPHIMTEKMARRHSLEQLA